MKKYKTDDYHNTIEAIEFERETKHFIWIDNRRFAKRSSYECYFDAFEEAKKHLLENAKRRIKKAKNELNIANKLYQVVNCLVEK